MVCKFNARADLQRLWKRVYDLPLVETKWILPVGANLGDREGKLVSNYLEGGLGRRHSLSTA